MDFIMSSIFLRRRSCSILYVGAPPKLGATKELGILGCDRVWYGRSYIGGGAWECSASLFANGLDADAVEAERNTCVEAMGARGGTCTGVGGGV